MENQIAHDPATATADEPDQFLLGLNNGEIPQPQEPEDDDPILAALRAR